jgi:hypothetical protein
MTRVTRIRIAQKAARPPATKPLKFGVLERIKVAERLLGPAGILPDTRLGIILSQPAARVRDLTGIIREILTFDRERHEATSDIITEAIREVEKMSEAKVMAEAQLVINRLYHEKISQHSNPAIKADFPSIPTVEVFSRLTSNGHFDPYQYFLSEGWGAIKMRLDYGKTVGYEKALNNFNLKQHLKEVFVVTRAFELIS